jgi:hypothetical protein
MSSEYVRVPGGVAQKKNVPKLTNNLENMGINLRVLFGETHAKSGRSVRKKKGVARKKSVAELTNNFENMGINLGVLFGERHAETGRWVRKNKGVARPGSLTSMTVEELKTMLTNLSKGKAKLNGEKRLLISRIRYYKSK